MAKRVLLSDFFGRNIFTRKSISRMFEEIEKSEFNNVLLDFKNIDFISRSCADEFVKRKKSSSKNISVSNMSPEVRKMIEIVNNDYNKEVIFN